MATPWLDDDTLRQAIKMASHKKDIPALDAVRILDRAEGLSVQRAWSWTTLC